LKAILNEPSVTRHGEWSNVAPEHIGYLDQHYSALDASLSVLEVIQRAFPKGTTHADLRTHLNRFLFRSNEEVQALTPTLSGGEKARLSLALISAKTPSLLLLDEVTNNLDLETRQHVIDVLKAYPGTLIVISHDEEFLHAIAVTTWYEIVDQTLRLVESPSN